MVDDNDLVYLRARYYAPALGVFTSLDPIENLNRYQYVGSNPANRVDPSGLQDAPLTEMCRTIDDPFEEFICQMCMDIEDPVEQAACITAGAWITSKAVTAAEVAGKVFSALKTTPGALLGSTVATAALTAYVCASGGSTDNPWLNLLTCGNPWPYGDSEDLRVPTPYASNAPEQPVGTPTPGENAREYVQNDPAICSTATPFPPSPAPTPSSNQANLDTSALTGLVAYDPKGATNAVEVKLLIEAYLLGRQLVATDTALTEFQEGLERLAGPKERTDAYVLISKIIRVPDNPSEQARRLQPTRSIGENDITILGTGDELGIETITGDKTAVDAARAQGFVFRYGVWIHPPTRFRERFV